MSSREGRSVEHIDIRTVDELLDLKGGTIDVIKGATIASNVSMGAGTIDVLKAGTVDVVKSATVDVVRDQQAGTIDLVRTPRSDQSATLASSFAVTGSDAIPGTFDTSQLDGFTVLLSPTGADGGTYTVEHELRADTGGSWFKDGQDGTLATDLVTTINHKARQYRPLLTQDTGFGAATLDVEAYGN